MLTDQLDSLKTLIFEFENNKRVNRVGAAKDLTSELDVSLSMQGSDYATLLSFAKDYLKLNPDVSQPAFYKLLYSGINEPALLGDWLTSLSNANMHTFQMSPVATLMELELINQWNQLLGFDQGDGVMVSGGSQANLVAMMLARHRMVSDCKEKGLQGKTLVAFVSDQAHYSCLRAANLLGIGTDNLVSVSSNDEGQMIPRQLDKQIQMSINKGHTPFYVGLTAGTTVIGAFDPIKPSSEIAKQHKLWLHVDAAWGAPVLFSKKHCHLMQNTKLADSVSWDAHKLLNVPLTASGIQVRKAGLLKDAILGGGAEYLFHQDENSEFNLGQRSIQCGRRADALKVWMSWKAAGSNGFATKVDYLQELKTYCVEQICKYDCFKLLAPTAYLNILFRYQPQQSMKEEQLRNLNISICKKLKKEGLAFIDYASFKGRSGIRLILANEKTKQEDIVTILKHCQVSGELLSNSK